MDAPRDESGETPASVPELTAAIASGDEAAFTQFHDLYWKRLYGYLMVLTKANETLAADLTQTTMVRAANRLPAMDSEVVLWGWLSRVARNAFVDACRSGKRRPLLVEWSDDSSAAIIDTHSMDTSLLTALDKALENLTGDERRLVEETYFARRKQVELAGELDLSLKALESRLTRLRRKLRQSILSSLRDE